MLKYLNMIENDIAQPLNASDSHKIFQCPIDEEFVALMMGTYITRN